MMNDTWDVTRPAAKTEFVSESGIIRALVKHSTSTRG